MSSLRKLRALRWEERWLLVQASFLLPLTAMVVHTMGVGRWQRVLARYTPLKKTSISNSHFATAKSIDLSQDADEGPSAFARTTD